MQYEIKYNSEFHFIEVTSFGEFTINDYKVQIEEAIRFGKTKNTFLFFVNNTQLKNSASITDIYNIPKLYRFYVGENQLKLAALFSIDSQNKEAISFYENICVNNGLNVKTFFDREEALQWLLSK